MTVSYDVFTASFLNRITEYTFLKLDEENRQAMIDDYMHSACADFKRRGKCKWAIDNGDDETRTFEFVDNDGNDITSGELFRVVNVVCEGMLYYWMHQHMYDVQILKNTLNTSDFATYSPAELLYRMTNAYREAEQRFIGAINQYSFEDGDLTKLHL